MSVRKETWMKIGAGVLLFCLGLLGGWFIKGTSAPVSIKQIRNPQSGFDLINPTLYIETPESLSYPKYTPLKNALTSYVDTANDSGKTAGVSVYFRDLDSSQWVGINPTEQYNPASMLKVVTLMALLRTSESNPQVLKAVVNVPASVALPASDQDFFPPVDPVQSGNTYAVSDLLTKLIVQSDNGANAILIQYMGDAAMSTVFSNLNVPVPGTNNSVTAQQYSHLFRVLYNASYLSPADSEKALELLSKTAFTQGLVAGVPSGVIVAHKFGEASTSLNPTDSPATHELHDCGIVYDPGHPYFLCVMTRGQDFTKLASVIKDISQITWNQMNALNK